LVIGFCGPLAPLGTGAVAVNAGSLSWVSPLVEAEQFALGTVVVVVGAAVVAVVVVGVVVVVVVVVVLVVVLVDVVVVVLVELDGGVVTGTVGGE
jgi:hypothetical protein